MMWVILVFLELLVLDLILSAIILCYNPSGLEKTVLELKKLGFDPSKSYFADALLAKRCTNKSKWNEKIDTYM